MDNTNNDNQNLSPEEQQKKQQALQETGGEAAKIGLDIASGGVASKVEAIPVVGTAAGKVVDKAAGKQMEKLDQATGGALGKVAEGLKDSGALDAVKGARKAASGNPNAMNQGKTGASLAPISGSSAGNKFRNPGSVAPVVQQPLEEEPSEEDLENMTDEEREEYEEQKLAEEQAQAEAEAEAEAEAKQQEAAEQRRKKAEAAKKIASILKDPIKRKILLIAVGVLIVLVLLVIAYYIIFKADIIGAGPDDYERDVGVLYGYCDSITLIKEDDLYYATHPNDVVANIDDVDTEEMWDSNGDGKKDRRRWETPETHELESYTKGVLQAEASHIADEKTYEAGAITARTYALQITSKLCRTWNNDNKRASYHNPQRFTKEPARSEIVEAVTTTDRIVMSINDQLLDLSNNAYYDNFCYIEKVGNYEDTSHNYYRMLQDNNEERLVIYGDWADENVDGGSAAVDSGTWNNSGSYYGNCNENGMSLYGAKYLLNLEIQPFYPRRLLQYYYGYNIKFMRIPANSAFGFGSGCFYWPLTGGTGRITSKFGPRKSPTAGASSNHEGMDIATPIGTSVLAADGGKVVAAGAAKGYGQWVKIDHGNGLTTIYGHLKKGGISVSVGQTVTQGQQIALSGNEGISTGPHLHFQVELNGTAVDPANYISQGNATPDCAAMYSATSPTLTGGRYSGKGSKEFINYIAKYAVEDMHKSGVLASITIAQAALESGWGKSKLAANYGNYFGIKANDWNGASVAMPTKEQTPSGYEYSKVDEFRAYTSPAGSIADHSAFLNKYERYVPVINAANYRDAAWALQNATYATDGQYANKLIAIIEANELYKYDQQ